MKSPSLRYRVPTVDGAPAPGAIIMGTSHRVRRGYRVISTVRTKKIVPGLGYVTWRVYYEPMSVQRAREEIAGGAKHWPIFWDRRERKRA